MGLGFFWLCVWLLSCKKQFLCFSFYKNRNIDLTFFKCSYYHQNIPENLVGLNGVTELESSYQNHLSQEISEQRKRKPGQWTIRCDMWLFKTAFLQFECHHPHGEATLAWLGFLLICSQILCIFTWKYVTLFSVLFIPRHSTWKHSF